MSKPLKKLLALLLLLPAFGLHAGEVARAQFTTDVIDREPVDKIEQLDSSVNQVRYFSELRDLNGQTVTHQWVYNDQVMFEKSFTPGGDRWRVWSSKTLQPGWSGIWYVHTLDADGNRLNSSNFTYR